MTMTASRYALIGRSFPSESFEGLYQTSIVSRRRQRYGIWAVGHPLPAQNAWLTAQRLPVVPSSLGR